MPRGPKGEKRPADVNARTVMFATGEVDDASSDDGKDPAEGAGPEGWKEAGGNNESRA